MQKFPWWLLLVGAGIVLLAGGVAVTANRRSGPRWGRLLPEAQGLADQLVRQARAAGLDVVFWDGWRSPEASAENMRAGTSKVRSPFDSLHVWGVAFDIVFVNAAGFPTWLEDASKPEGWVDPRWKKLAAIGQQLGLYSGGLNWGWDWPHFQLPGYAASTLRARYGNDYLAFLSQRGAVA